MKNCTKIYLTLILSLLSLFFSCEKKEEKDSHVASETKGDTLVLEDTTIVLLSPSDLEIEAMKKKHGEEDFYTIADDVSGYVANAYEKLDANRIRYTTSDSRFIYFKKLGKLIDKDTISDKWAIVFLNKQGQIQIIDPIDFDLNYFLTRSKESLENWKGKYSCIIDYGSVDELSGAMVSYRVIIKSDSIYFSGSGYQTDFEYACESSLSADTLELFYSNTISGNPYNESDKMIGKLFQIDSEYFIKSPVIYALKDGKQTNNLPVLMKKK